MHPWFGGVVFHAVGKKMCRLFFFLCTPWYTVLWDSQSVFNVSTFCESKSVWLWIFQKTKGNISFSICFHFGTLEFYNFRIIYVIVHFFPYVTNMRNAKWSSKFQNMYIGCDPINRLVIFCTSQHTRICQRCIKDNSCNVYFFFFS